MRARHLLMGLLALLVIGPGTAEAKELTTVSYTVSAGDTMTSIAKKYLPYDRGTSQQAFEEFREGIYEYNYARIFIDRIPYEVRAGDCLFISYWE